MCAVTEQRASFIIQRRIRFISPPPPTRVGSGIDRGAPSVRASNRNEPQRHRGTEKIAGNERAITSWWERAEHFPFSCLILVLSVSLCLCGSFLLGTVKETPASIRGSTRDEHSPPWSGRSSNH